MSTDTPGVDVEPADLQALVDNLLADLADIHDPLARYHELTVEQVLHDRFVSEIKKLRGVELRRMADGDPDQGVPGMSLESIGEVTGIGTKQGVWKVIAPSTH